MVSINLSVIPKGPGVYRFVDSRSRTVYVGKAKNLRARLGNYAREQNDPRIARMLEIAADVSYVTCSSETEALLLEREWIKREQPPFNVRMRHGDGYAGVAITKGPVPRLHSWRGRKPQGAEAFGPYPGISGRALIKSLASAFHVRTCKDKVYDDAERTGRPCLLGETGACLAPCLKGDRAEAHADAVNRLRGFLAGGGSRVIASLEEAMEGASAGENYEAAASLRDTVKALEPIAARQTVLAGKRTNATAVAVRLVGDDVVAAVCTSKAGVLVHAETLRSVREPGCAEETEAAKAVQSALEAAGIREQAISSVLVEAQVGCGTRSPRGKGEKALLLFTERQADEAARKAQLTPWQGAHERMSAVLELSALLYLPEPARHIEALDISHLNGRSTRGQIVTLLDGYPKRSLYRSVPIPEAGGDDFHAIQQVLRKRFSGSALGLPQRPDLLLIDGGRPQVEAAGEVLEELGVRLPLLGLAKRMEEVWTSGSDAPLILPRGSAALRLLMHARDCAHDGAISKHRKDRGAAATLLAVDRVRGIGPRKKEALLAAFTTWDGVLGAARGDLQEVLGKGTGARLYGELHPE